jgi:hypothetical protein
VEDWVDQGFMQIIRWPQLSTLRPGLEDRDKGDRISVKSKHRSEEWSLAKVQDLSTGSWTFWVLSP